MASESQESSIEFLKLLLGTTLKIDLIDERQLIGTFHCIDKDCNIVLMNTKEILTNSPNPRELGTAMISRKNLKNICVPT